MRAGLLLPLAVMLAGCEMAKLPALPSIPGIGPKPAEAKYSVAAAQEPPPAPANQSLDESCRRMSAAQARAERLVVLINTSFGAGTTPEIGAGLIFAETSQALLIVTAAHVVKRPGSAAPRVTVSLGEGRASANAIVSARFAAPREPYSDLAVLEVHGAKAPAGLDWQMLRGDSDMTDTRDFVVIGNPAGRGMTTTKPGPGDFQANEVKVFGTTMEPGFSGGGVFDSQRRLVALTKEDQGQFASAYPIGPVIRLLEAAGFPVHLKAAPSAARNIFLAGVVGRPDALAAGVRKAMTRAMQDAGFDAACGSSDSYRMSLQVSSRAVSGTTTEAVIKGIVERPGGGQMPVEPHATSFIHAPWQSPLESEERVLGGIKDTVNKIVDDVKLGIQKMDATTAWR